MRAGWSTSRPCRYPCPASRCSRSAPASAICSGFLILENCVSYDTDESLVFIDEDASDHTNTISGRGCLPSRPWIYRRLSELFEHVYMPPTQPVHEQFRLTGANRDHQRVAIARSSWRRAGNSSIRCCTAAFPTGSFPSSRNSERDRVKYRQA